jgi:hypothetical protein
MTPSTTDTISAPDSIQTIKFRCPPELDGVLPRPIPAVRGLPDWFKSMPQTAFSTMLQVDQMTVKKCPPVIDAMTAGFLMPLICDLHVRDGEFSWDRDVPAGVLTGFLRAPIDFHDNNQLVGTPFFDSDQFAIKFNNYWTFELPSGYSLLITHPINRADLPFTTLTGLVDADRYTGNFVNFPAHWRDPGFAGTLPKGTPVAQCIPVKRDSWEPSFEVIDEEAVTRQLDLSMTIIQEPGIYRRQFRAPKR